MGIDVEDFYRRYGPMVLRRCRQLLKDEHAALDAMQDTFVKVLRYQNRLNTAGPSSLLYRIATNICLNMIRSQKRQVGAAAEDILSAIASSDDTENRFIIRELIDRIFRPEKADTKLIAVMYFVDGMTYEEVAGEVGLSVSGVRKRLRALREHVKELEV